MGEDGFKGKGKGVETDPDVRNMYTGGTTERERGGVYGKGCGKK